MARDAATRLRAEGVPEPEASAESLLAELLGIGRADLAMRDEPLTSEQARLYEEYVGRRMAREPVQRILGYGYFRNLKLWLNEETLIPRPDTESVVEAALELVDAHPCPPLVLDVGTGSGAIAIALAQERPRCEVHATDISPRALEAARVNARRNGTNVEFHVADVVDGLSLAPKSVGLLVSNPPYVGRQDEGRLAPEVLRWDPAVALFSEGENLSFYRRIFPEAAPLLDDGAGVVVEVGETQAEAVMELGLASGYEPLGTRTDLAGSTRAVMLRWRS